MSDRPVYYGSLIDARDAKLLLLSLGLLLGATAVAGAAVGLRRLRLPAVVLAVIAAVVWLAVDRRLEGPVLVAFAEDHGLVLADLLVLPPGLLVVLLLVLEVRQRR